MSRKYKEYFYYETLKELIKDTVDNPEFKEKYTINIWKRYLSISTKDKVYTHNSIKYIDYTPEELSLLNILSFRSGKKGILYPFLDSVAKLPRNTSVAADIFYRQYTHLPLSWIDYKLKNEMVNNIIQLDINKMYIATFLDTNPYSTSPEYKKLLNEKFEASEGITYIKALVKGAWTDKLPIVQPRYSDNSLMDDLLFSSSSATLPENGVVYLIHAQQPDGKIYSTYDYFMTNYKYENFKILEQHHQEFTNNRIFDGVDIAQYTRFLNNFIDKSKEAGTRLNIENKFNLAIMLGKMFPKPTITGDYLRTNYQWDPIIKKFNYDYKENENPKFEVDNQIFQVPYMYLILQDFVFKTFGPHFHEAIHIGADSITFSKDYYSSVAEQFPLGDKVGEWKKTESYGIYMYSPKNYAMYDKDENLTKITLSGVSREDKEKYLKNLDDWKIHQHLEFSRNLSIDDYLNKQRTYTEDVRSEMKTKNPYDFPDLITIPDKSLILAPARTGKTTSVLSFFAGRRVLHLFYNKVPQTQIKCRSENIDNNDNYEVRTMDSWIQQNYPGKARSYWRMRAWFIANIDKMVEVLKKYDHIIIDEVQSNYGKLAEIVLLLTERLPKLTLLGDFDQQLEKVRRDNQKLTLSDFPNIPKFRLNTNYQTPQSIAKLAESYISTSVDYISQNEGKIYHNNFISKEEMVDYIKRHSKRYGMIICRHKQLRDELTELTGVEILSVSQSLSWDAEDVLLVSSTKLNPIMDEYEQRLEIKNAIMRSTNTINILEVYN